MIGVTFKPLATGNKTHPYDFHIACTMHKIKIRLKYK